MASIARTSAPRPLAIGSLAILRIVLTTLLLSSIVLDDLQAREMTFAGDSEIQVRRQNRLSAPHSSKYSRSTSSSPKYSRSAPSSPYGRSLSSYSVNECSIDYAFDHLQLTLMWSPGTCSTSPQSCIRGNVSGFTIHGLWPQSQTSEGPQDCCFQKNFIIEYLKPIMPALDQFWPSYFSTENRFFWSHEWRKHGTCTKNVAALSGEYRYFSSTLNLFKKLPILQTLKRANIVPSDDKKYDSGSIVKALRLIHNKSIQIDCDYEHDQPVPLITGLNFCYDKQLNPIDCPEMKRMCSRQSLKFPATVARFSSAFKYGTGNNNSLQSKRSVHRAFSFK